MSCGSPRHRTAALFTIGGDTTRCKSQGYKDHRKVVRWAERIRSQKGEKVLLCLVVINKDRHISSKFQGTQIDSTPKAILQFRFVFAFVISLPGSSFVKGEGRKLQSFCVSNRIIWLFTESEVSVTLSLEHYFKAAIHALQPLSAAPQPVTLCYNQLRCSRVALSSRG